MKALWLWLILALQVVGCYGPGAIQAAYENADWLVGKEVERRLCPSSTRRAAYERAIDRLHRWHRTKELPNSEVDSARTHSAIPVRQT